MYSRVIAGGVCVRACLADAISCVCVLVSALVFVICRGPKIGLNGVKCNLGLE